MIALGILPCSGNLSLHGELLGGLLCCHALKLGVLLIQQVRHLHRGQEFAYQVMSLTIEVYENLIQDPPKLSTAAQLPSVRTLELLWDERWK